MDFVIEGLRRFPLPLLQDMEGLRFSCTRALNTAVFAVVETRYVLLHSPQVGSTANSLPPHGTRGQPGVGRNTVLSLCIGGHWGRGWRRKRHGETQREAYPQERWWDEVSRELRDIPQAGCRNPRFARMTLCRTTSLSPLPVGQQRGLEGL